MNFFHLIYEHSILSLVAYLFIGYLIATKSWNLWTKPGHSRWVARLFFPVSSFFAEVTEEMDGYWHPDSGMLKTNYNKSSLKLIVPMAQYTHDAPITWQYYKSTYFKYTVLLWPFKVTGNCITAIFLILCSFTEWSRPYKESA